MIESRPGSVAGARLCEAQWPGWVTATANVTRGSQPPVAFNLNLVQPAGSGWLDRLVRPSGIPAP